MKEGGNFVVAGSLKWISDVEVSVKNSKKLRECHLHDGIDHMTCSVWEKNINLLQENSWYKLTDVSVKRLYGVKLATTPKTLIQKIDGEQHNIDWSNIDVKNYLLHEKKYWNP